jgi:hypothetical protein
VKPEAIACDRLENRKRIIRKTEGRGGGEAQGVAGPKKVFHPPNQISREQF